MNPHKQSPQLNKKLCSLYSHYKSIVSLIQMQNDSPHRIQLLKYQQMYQQAYASIKNSLVQQIFGISNNHIENKHEIENYYLMKYQEQKEEAEHYQKQNNMLKNRYQALQQKMKSKDMELKICQEQFARFREVNRLKNINNIEKSQLQSPQFKNVDNKHCKCCKKHNVKEKEQKYQIVQSDNNQNKYERQLLQIISELQIQNKQRQLTMNAHKQELQFKLNKLGLQNEQLQQQLMKLKMENKKLLDRFLILQRQHDNCLQKQKYFTFRLNQLQHLQHNQ